MTTNWAHAHQLYAEAIAADEAFSAALTAEYGKDACNMRYERDLPPHLAALGDAKVAADRRYFDAVDEARKANADKVLASLQR